MPSSKRRVPGPTGREAAASGADAAEPGEAADVAGEAADESWEPATRSLGGRIPIVAGIAYSIIGFIGWSLLPVGKVQPADSAAAIAKQVLAERGRISAGILLTLFSLFFLLVFVAWLHRWLRDAEGPDGWAATLALIGGALTVAMLLVVVLLSIATTVLDKYGADEVIARALLVIQWQAVAVAFIPSAAFVGGISLVGWSSGRLPRWLVFGGFFIAVGLLVPPLAFLPFLLSSLWIGVLAVVLLRQSRYGS